MRRGATVVKKSDKKELLEPDKLQTISQGVVEFIMIHKRQLFIAAGTAIGIFLLAAGAVLYSLYYENQAEKMYAEAIMTQSKTAGKDATGSDFMNDAVKIYDTLIKEYSRSDAASRAYFNLGNAYYEMNETDKAIDAYKMFTENSSKDNVLTSLAYYGLGYCYERKGEFSNALESFKNADTTIEGEQFKAVNAANIARMHERMNNKKEALEYYRQALKLNNDPLMNLIMKRRIAALS